MHPSPDSIHTPARTSYDMTDRFRMAYGNIDFRTIFGNDFFVAVSEALLTLFGRPLNTKSTGVRGQHPWIDLMRSKLRAHDAGDRRAAQVLVAAELLI